MGLLSAMFGSGGTFGSRMMQGISHPGGLLAQMGVGQYANLPSANSGLIGTLTHLGQNQYPPRPLTPTQPQDPWANLRSSPAMTPAAPQAPAAPAASQQTQQPMTAPPTAQQPVQHADLASMVSAWLRQHQMG